MSRFIVSWKEFLFRIWSLVVVTYRTNVISLRQIKIQRYDWTKKVEKQPIYKVEKETQNSK